MSYEKGSFKYAVIPDMEELERLMRTNAELLEALKELHKVVSEYEDLVCSEAPSTHRNAMDKACQAIAKAEGK